MNKKNMIKAWKEALKQAQEMLDFYKGYIKTAEDLETKDTSEITCIGSFFNCFPNSGWQPSEEEQEEGIADLCEKADDRKARKEHFYKVAFFDDNVGICKYTLNVCQRGARNDEAILAKVLEQYPQFKGFRAVIHTIKKSEY